MPRPCKKGEIWRVGHVRKISKKNIKRNSKKDSKIHVRGKCIKATSQTGQKTSDVTRQILKEKDTIHKLAREKFGTPICDTGEVVREGSYRTSQSGKKIWTSPTCIPDVGRIGKSKQIIYVEPERLSKYGYENIVERSDLSRHKSLMKAMREGEKPLSVSRRLNALATLTRNTNSNLSRKLKEDSEWIKLTDEYKLSRQHK